ncbi:MAG: DNRLRE domain-containing protein [Chloroflexi bacterium]|nr:DNRLRE domain-containing protein [Chloroflexota bacterium]
MKRSRSVIVFAILALLLLLIGLLGTAATGAQSPVSAPPDDPRPALAIPQASVTLQATEDATIDSAAPDTNYGSDPRLKVAYTAGRPATMQHALLRFNLAGQLPAGAVVDSASLTLRLAEAAGLTSVTIGAYTVSGEWSEGRVTWNSRPATGLPSASAVVGTSTVDTTWDVTELARAWLSQGDHGLELRGPEDGLSYARAFRSSEGEAWPRLAVIYHIAPTITPTPTRTATATATRTRTPTLPPTASPTASPTGPASEADLSVSKADVPDPVEVSRPLTYTITVINNSRTGATDVRLTDRLPQGVTFASASPGCAQGGGVVTCRLGDLAGGHRIEATLVVTAPTSSGIITNTVSVDANERDPIPANNTATQATLVVEPPLRLVTDGLVSYAVAAPKIFTHTRPGCGGASGAAAPPVGFEAIGRVAVYGSPTRYLRREARGCADPGDVRSNIVADARYIYWTSDTGLMRLATDANPGDPPGLLSNAVRDAAELAQDSANIYVDLLGDPAQIYRVRKADGAAALLRTVAGGASHLSADGEYLYWVTGGRLQRHHLAQGVLATLASGVTGYHAEGTRPCPTGAGGCVTKYVFIAQGRQVVHYNNVDDSTSAPIYTSGVLDAEIYDLTSDENHVFGLEEDPTPGRTDLVIRTPRLGGETRLLHSIGADKVHAADSLEVAGNLIYWIYADALEMANKAPDWLSLTNLRITGMLVTQGVQNRYETVPLIENRRTFVRVFVASDGPIDVSGVTAHLYGWWWYPVVSAGPVEPINDSGKTITVRQSPDPNNLNDSFLFELPLDWTLHQLLAFRVELNPYHVPPEPDYTDNTKLLDSVFWFRPSPRLEAQFVMFGYSWNGVEYWPRLEKDLGQAYSWIQRVYPLASPWGLAGDPSPGFRPYPYWYVFDDALGGHVNQTSQFCYDNYTAKGHADLLEFCASYYTNAQLYALRTEWGLPAGVFMYGMISDGLKFPRGQADGPGISSGPAGIPGKYSWDTDGSYADWYAAHEVGHTVGRSHPAQGNWCGQSADDLNFPYWGARIGPGDGSVEGFDAGDPYFGIPRAVYPDNLWTDLMSYCDYQWISDHNYECIYQFLMTGQNTGQCSSGQATGYSTLAAANSIPAAPIAGDWLNLFGLIMTDTGQANISYLRRLSSVATIPPRLPGPYRIQLLDAGGAVLSDYPFTAYKPQNGGPAQLNFSQVIPFAAGTTTVRIVDAAGREMDSQPISPHPPVVSNVALQAAPDPVTGSVTLGWEASDLDGDPLRFEVLYSRDGGTSFQQIHVNVTGASIPVDTTLLAGSTQAILRVVASDGSQSAYADSSAFRMANKPPQVRIISPADGAQVHYGQLLNLSGEALDLQDEGVSGGGLVWANQRGFLGSGGFLALTDLAVGVNWITLTATNTAGLSASASVTVTVDDDLDLPGPTLSVGPSQVGWHVALGTTQPQTATLSISNAGSGVLTYAVSSSAAWLTVSPTSGVAPAAITLTADPAGAADGTLRKASLEVQGTDDEGGPAQAITVPVSLAVGNVWASPGHTGMQVYLPLTLKR